MLETLIKHGLLTLCFQLFQVVINPNFINMSRTHSCMEWLYNTYSHHVASYWRFTVSESSLKRIWNLLDEIPFDLYILSPPFPRGFYPITARSSTVTKETLRKLPAKSLQWDHRRQSRELPNGDVIKRIYDTVMIRTTYKEIYKLLIHYKWNHIVVSSMSTMLTRLWKRPLNFRVVSCIVRPDKVAEILQMTFANASFWMKLSNLIIWCHQEFPNPCK